MLMVTMATKEKRHNLARIKIQTQNSMCGFCQKCLLVMCILVYVAGSWLEIVINDTYLLQEARIMQRMNKVEQNKDIVLDFDVGGSRTYVS